jgi:hypothetical protein
VRLGGGDRAYPARASVDRNYKAPTIIEENIE